MIKLMYKGTEYTYNELSDLTGVSVNVLRQRILRGHSVEDAVNYKAKYNKATIRYNGCTYTIKELSDKYGISYSTLYNRLLVNDWSMEKAINYKGTNYNTTMYEYKGKRYTIAELSMMTKLSITTLTNRIKLGYSMKESIDMGRLKNVELDNRGLLYHGNPVTVKDLVRMYKYKEYVRDPDRLLRSRLYAGWSVERTVSTPPVGISSKKKVH